MWPRKRQIALVGLLGGLLLGAGFVLLRDALDNTLKDADDVERHLHLELLAAIPRYGKDDATLATEAYQNLRTALLFSRRGDEGQVVLVTGTAPGEGKTTTLLNVAKLLAVSGESVVVVDCDLRRANLHLRLNVPARAGLHRLLREGPGHGGARADDARPEPLGDRGRDRCRPTRRRCSRGPSSPTRCCALKRQYRWVLVDSPPVAAVTDALLLAQRADATILVVQQNKVDRAMVKRALAALRKVTPHVIGAVLNAVDVKSKGYYGYGYYGSRKDSKDKPASRGPQGRRAQPHAVIPEPEVTDASLV